MHSIESPFLASFDRTCPDTLPIHVPTRALAAAHVDMQCLATASRRSCAAGPTCWRRDPFQAFPGPNFVSLPRARGSTPAVWSAHCARGGRGGCELRPLVTLGLHAVWTTACECATLVQLSFVTYLSAASCESSERISSVALRIEATSDRIVDNCQVGSATSTSQPSAVST